jgi:hypothetical protein
MLGAGIGAASVAAVISGAGPAMASTTPAASGTLQFQIMTTSATASTESIIATGLFTAGGVDHPGNTVDTVAFPGGTFKISHSPGAGPQTFNPTTCLLTVNQHGTYTISHGTGKFAGISGHGRYQISILKIGARSGGACSQSKPPLAFQQVIRASGPASLP